MAAHDVREGQLTGGEDAPLSTEVSTSTSASAAPVLTAAPPLWRRLADAVRRVTYRYPELPPAPKGRWPRIAFTLVALCALAYVVFFAALLFTMQDAFMTHAEDLGMMDQALWTTLHGAPLHQTICNSVHDTNCLGDVSRLAIHFEPIMFPLALTYLFAPSPKTLQLIQALVVACGAFPAFWLASRRLQSALAGLVFALCYLLFPALQAAVTSDFHAVTLSAAFIMFACYFLVARNDAGLIIACVLALATKEEIPVDVAMLGLSVLLFQHRRKMGLTLLGLAVAWLGIALLGMHLASPLGHSPTAGRYAQFGHSPLQVGLYLLTHPLTVLRDTVLDPAHQYYIRVLLAPVAYLPLLSPLTLLIAVPAMAINLLSSDPAMYSGLYQYNAEIVPVMIFAAIESVALLRWLAEEVTERGVLVGLRFGVGHVAAGDARTAAPRYVARGVLLLLLALTLVAGVYEQRDHGYTPLAKGFTWPQVTAHDALANSFIGLIPPDASVSAASDLIPHLSHRHYVYLYPYQGTTAQYVLLDVTGNLYPLDATPQVFFSDVRALLHNPNYHVIAARDGYLLFVRGAGPQLNPADPNGLPASFYSFTRTSAAPPHPLDVRFGNALDLAGYTVSPAPTLYLNRPDVTVTTYWHVRAPLPPGTALRLVFTRQDGTEYVNDTFAATEWQPMSRWKPGETLVVRSWPLLLSARELGTLKLGVAVMAPQTNGTPAALTARVLSAGQGAGANAVELLAGRTVAAFYDERVAQ